MFYMCNALCTYGANVIDKSLSIFRHDAIDIMPGFHFIIFEKSFKKSPKIDQGHKNDFRAVMLTIREKRDYDTTISARLYRETKFWLKHTVAKSQFTYKESTYKYSSYIVRALYCCIF